VSDAALPRILADPGLTALYEAMLAEVGRLGPFEVRYRKSAVQVVRPDGAAVFALHPEQGGLMVTLVLAAPSASPRFVVSQQLSSDVWNQRLRLRTLDDVDGELCGWLAAAYRRGAAGRV
jgi:hypothetical protein